MYIKSSLAGAEFSNLYGFSCFPQLYSEVGNTNSRLDTTLSSSVLDYALTLSEGLHAVRFPGDSYTGTDIPNNNLSKLGNLRFLAANTFTDAWNKAEAGYTYFIDIILDTSNADSPITAANRWFGQMWKNDTGKYGWQVAWSFNGTIYKRERNNSDAWTDWNTYALKSDLNNVSNKLMLDGMQTLSVKWANSDTLEFYVDNTRVFGILAKWVEITHKS